MSRGKLVNDLSPTQCESLVKVLSSPSAERDFKHLLTPSNLQEVFDHPEEFILPQVPHLNFKGSSGAQAKERALSRLLSQIKESSEMLRSDASDAFPLPLPLRRTPQARLKRPRELETDGVVDLR